MCDTMYAQTNYAVMGATMPEIPPTTMWIDPELKEAVRPILDELGMSLSGAVTMFLKAMVREGGIPFDVRNVVVYEEHEATIGNETR